MLQVNDYHRLLSAKTFVGVSVHSGTRPCGQFGKHIPTVQVDGIVTGRRFLIVMREMRLVQFPVQRVRVIGGDGHQEHVSVIQHSGSAQVSVAEADDGVVGIMIAGAALPGVHPGIGAELHHAERSRGSGKSMAGKIRSDHRINVIHKPLLCPAA